MTNNLETNMGTLSLAHPPINMLSELQANINNCLQYVKSMADSFVYDTDLHYY